jgi:hypothetical protein
MEMGITTQTQANSPQQSNNKYVSYNKNNILENIYYTYICIITQTIIRSKIKWQKKLYHQVYSREKMIYHS